MARIHALPSLEIIRGLKGILDFYMWKGLPCVRAWPQYRPAKQTAASLAAALVFGAIVKSYGLLGDLPLEAYRHDALDQTRTARDIMVTATYGNLHEASMSDFLDALIVSRDALVALTALLNALHSVDTDEIVVRTEHSVLPDGAATSPAQATQLTALQKIDDLQDALQSKALDRLLVRGQDQLFSFHSRLHERTNGNPNPLNGSFDSAVVPANQVWLVTTIGGLDATKALTGIRFGNYDPPNDAIVHEDRRGAAIGEWQTWSGLTVLQTGAFIRAYFLGFAVDDDVYVDLTGYIMTLET